jgi:hypothetical protein
MAAKAEAPIGFAVNGKVLYGPTPKQIQFHNCPARNVLYGGAAGGGKSHALRWDAYMRCLTKGGYRALLLRRTYPELEATHLDQVEIDIADGLPATYLKSDRKVVFRNGSVLRFGHCEDDAAVARYLSTEYHAIYFDELVTFTEKQYLMVRSRARAPKASGIKPMIRAGTNPGGPESHWVRRRFIWQDITAVEDKRYRPEDYVYIPATLDDNPHLDQEEYAANLESLPEELARAYRHGDWDIFPGQYFGEWRKDKHVTAEHVEWDRSLPRVCSVDWGFVKPGSCGWWVLLPEGRVYREDEYIFTRTVAADVARAIVARSKERGIKVRYTVGDTAMWTPDGQTGETIAETFARNGVPMQQADKDRINGWQRFRAWLKDAPDGVPWLQSSPNCAYFNRTIPALVSDDHKPEDVDSDGEDHAADEARYFFMSRPHPTGVKVKPSAKPWSMAWIKQQGARSPGILGRRSA